MITTRLPGLRKPREVAAAGTAAAAPVFLNVYDVTPANGYARWLGLGIYHSGVQVHGVEFAYGAHDKAASGIFEAEPRRCPGFVFREAVLIGATELRPAEVKAVMAELASEFPGDAYNLVSKNCNHFCDAACRLLTDKPIPKWVNRLAKIGVVFNCVIPGNGKLVRRQTERERAARLRSRSTRHAALPPPPAAATSPAFFRSLSVGGRRAKRRSSSSSSSLFLTPPSTSSSSSSSSS